VFLVACNFEREVLFACDLSESDSIGQIKPLPAASSHFKNLINR
jgi:hypothetical protein